MGQLLADPVAEARQLICLAMEQGLGHAGPGRGGGLPAIGRRLEGLRGRIDAEPKSRRWRMRNQVGDKVRWYAEPEQEQPGGE